MVTPPPHLSLALARHEEAFQNKSTPYDLGNNVSPKTSQLFMRRSQVYERTRNYEGTAIILIVITPGGGLLGLFNAELASFPGFCPN